MEHCCVDPWSFGQEGEEEHKLKDLRGIATNSSGQFIVGNINVLKMFSSSGQFIKDISIPNDDVETKLYIYDVATDNKDYIYVLVRYLGPGSRNLLFMNLATPLTCITSLL